MRTFSEEGEDIADRRFVVDRVNFFLQQIDSLSNIRVSARAKGLDVSLRMTVRELVLDVRVSLSLRNNGSIGKYVEFSSGFDWAYISLVSDIVEQIISSCKIALIEDQRRKLR